MTNLPITTTISPEFHALCIERGWKWKDIIARGVMAMRGDGDLKDDIVEMNEGIKKLQRRLTEYATKDWEQNQKIEILTKEIHKLGGKVDIVVEEKKEDKTWQK